MANATTQVNSIGRGPNLYCQIGAISISVTGVATAYAAAGGGLPFDLTAVLQTASAGMIPGGQAPNYIQTINPADIVGVDPGNTSTNHFLPMDLVVGVPTYTPVPWQYAQGVSATPGILATCPCTIRLWGTGAAAGGGFQQVADGANSDAFTTLLLINANGANN